MKRIPHSCFLLILLLFAKYAHAQPPNYTLTPGVQCYNPSLATYTTLGVVTVTSPCLNAGGSYTYVVQAPPGGSYTLVPAPGGSTIALQVSGCGVYTLDCYPYLPNGIPCAGGQLPTHYFTVECQSQASITATPTLPVLCAGYGTTLTGLGGATYTWISQNAGGTNTLGSANPLVVNPSINTTYTLSGTTANSCALIPTTKSFSVQNATITATPANATLCTGAPVTLGSTSGPVTGTNNSAGTTTTSVLWYAPGGGTISTAQTTVVPAANGQYTVVLKHTGGAGTCTTSAAANVTTINVIPLSLKGNGVSSPSVCPGGTVSLLGSIAPSATTALAYTWTSPSGPPNNANPVTKTVNVVSVYTCDVTYYGCTGTNTIQVGLSSLTPTLTSSSPSTCPGRSLTLTASGGSVYTFSAITATNFTITPLNKPTPTTATHAPSGFQLPIQYCVSSTSAGCTGSTCITVGLLTLNTSLSSNHASVCPNSSLILTGSNGAGTSYTFSSLSGTFVGTSTTSTINANVGGSPLPNTFSVSADSAGCKGSAILQVDELVLTPSLSASSNSICPGKTVTINAFAGAGTHYTFTAPYNTTSASTFTFGNTSNLVTNATTTVPLIPGLPYQYTVSVDSAGCSGSNTINIGQLTLTPTLTASQYSVCPNSVITLTAWSAPNYTFLAPYVIPTTSNNIISTGTLNVVSTTLTGAPSSFPKTFTVVCDSVGCTGSSTINISLLNLAQQFSLSILSAPSVTATSVCPGQSFSLQVNGYTSGNPDIKYTYKIPPVPPGLSTTTVSNIFALTSSTASPFPLTYTVTADSLGCSGTSTITVSKRTLSVSLTASTLQVCAGSSVALTATPSAYNYTLAAVSPSALVSTGPGTAIVHPTVQTVYLAVADSAGCTTPTIPSLAQSVTVSIIPALNLSLTASSPSVCAGLPTTLSVNGGTVPSISYTWSPLTQLGTLTPGPVPSSSAVAIPTISGQYTVVGVDPLGCVGQATINIGIDPNATYSLTVASPINTICTGLQTTLTANSSLNPVNFVWTPTTGLTGFNTATVVASPSITGTYIYSVTANNGWGCTATTAYTITVGTYPHITISPTASNVCAGYNSTLTAFGANSYTWTSGSFTTGIAQQSISVGVGTYSVVGTNGGGCRDSTYISIGSQPPLVLTPLPASATTCIENNSPKYSKPVVLTVSGANSYVWYPYNPINMTYSLGPSTTVRPPATTQYTIIGSTGVCSGSAVVNVTVIPQFTMNVVPPLPYMCKDDSLKLSIVNIGSLAVGPTSAFSYSWTDSSPISISSKFTPTVTVFPLATSVYSAQVKDARGCVSLQKLVTVTVLPRPETAVAIPTINNVPTNTVCFVGLNPGPEDVVLNLTGVNKNTNLQFGLVPTYTWVSPYPVKYPSILTPPNNPGVTINAPLKLPSLVTYTLLSGYNGVPGCYRADTVSVRVIDCRPVTAVSFTTGEKVDTICSRNCITFINLTDTAAGGTQTVSWSFRGGNPAVSTKSIQTVCYNLPGKFDVILTVSNPYPKNPPNGQAPGSSNNLGVQSFVKVVDVPNVTIISPGGLRSDTTIRFGTPVDLHGSGALYYSWSPNYNITALDKPNVTVKPFKTTQYILTGRNSRDCESSDTLNVIVIEDCGEMYVPNAFTPNKDGVNDVLYVRGICLKSLTFMVFNRWGEKVFETADQSVGWDGSYKGEDLNTGVFVYRLEGRTYDGKQFSAKGNITLIR